MLQKEASQKIGGSLKRSYLGATKELIGSPT